MRGCAIPAHVLLLALILGCLDGAEAKPAPPPAKPAISAVRTTDDMRGTGRKALWSLLRALDPPVNK
jgi:hypothetical protein